MWIRNGWKQNLIQLEGKSEKQYNWKNIPTWILGFKIAIAQQIEYKTRFMVRKNILGKKLELWIYILELKKFWIFALKIEQKLKILEFWLFLACKFKLRNQWITIFFCSFFINWIFGHNLRIIAWIDTSVSLWIFKNR